MQSGPFARQIITRADRLALVLLFEGRTPCSTSYYSPLGILLLYELLLFELYLAINYSSTSHSSRKKNTPTLRVITLREGRILPLYESLCFKPAVNRQPGFRTGGLVEQDTFETRLICKPVHKKPNENAKKSGNPMTQKPIPASVPC